MTSKSKPTTRRSTTSRKTATSARKTVRSVAAAKSDAAQAAPETLGMDEEVLYPEPEITIPAEVTSDATTLDSSTKDTGPDMTMNDDSSTELTVDSAAETDEAVQVEEIPVVPQPELKKKELVDLAVERSGVKKRDAKPAIEAALAVLGAALAEGRELNIVPLGKVKVTRMKKGGNGQIINARVRQPEDADISLDDPLAQAAE